MPALILKILCVFLVAGGDAAVVRSPGTRPNVPLNTRLQKPLRVPVDLDGQRLFVIAEEGATPAEAASFFLRQQGMEESGESRCFTLATARNGPHPPSLA